MSEEEKESSFWKRSGNLIAFFAGNDLPFTVHTDP
ncbi:hypothetical protein ANHS_1465 [Ligilactobacillus ruminis ATCC 25644]|nr:hypothetical protein ANHS_1465 [Ligilactobacillus ruminis ATCC 25644]